MAVEDPIFMQIFTRITTLFSGSTGINPINKIHRFKSDQYIGTHTDQLGSPDINFGVVLYINDNYNGGEIVYPSDGVMIKPIARSLVIHPGDMPHKTNPVIGQNYRYMISTFVHGPNTTINTNLFSEVNNV
jgi:hypothetical protein